MPEHEVVDAELVPYEPPTQPLNLFGAAEPEAVIERAAAVATTLAKVIEDKNLYKDIQGRKHVLVEGWTLLGSMLGVFAHNEVARSTADIECRIAEIVASEP